MAELSWSRILTIAAALVCHAAAENSAVAQLSFEEKRLLTVPAPPAGWLAEEWEPIISADGRRAAAVVPLWKGRKPRPMYGLGITGKQICYLLAIDEQVVNPCNWTPVPPSFSGDARHVIHVERDRAGAAISLDGKLVDRSTAWPRQVWVMADGTPGYVLEDRGSRHGTRQQVVVGGRREPWYERVGDVLLSPDGASLAYVATAAGRESVLIGGRGRGDFANVQEMRWSAQGRELVVLARSAACAAGPESASCWCVSRGHGCLPEEDLSPGPIAVSPDGASVAVVRQRALKNDGYRPDRDDRFWISYRAFRGPELFRVNVGPILDGTGTHLAYAGTTAAGRVQVFRDATAMGAPVEQVNDLALSPDGAHVAWTGGAPGRFRAFVDGAPSSAWAWAEHVTLDPTGHRVAFAARQQSGGPWRIVAGTAVGPACDWVGVPRWSADGRRIAYAARIGREVWWKVLDVS
jgi:WD40-like Beta Propeller Repeat